jgi:hypothetical protein
VGEPQSSLALPLPSHERPRNNSTTIPALPSLLTPLCHTWQHFPPQHLYLWEVCFVALLSLLPCLSLPLCCSPSLHHTSIWWFGGFYMHFRGLWITCVNSPLKVEVVYFLHSPCCICVSSKEEKLMFTWEVYWELWQRIFCTQIILCVVLHRFKNLNHYCIEK